MLEVVCHVARGELLVDGHRRDYDELVACTRQLFASPNHSEASLEVASRGETLVKRLVVRKGEIPNRTFCESGDVVLTVAPKLLHCFLSYLQFPSDEDLPNSPIRYHHHYDW